MDLSQYLEAYDISQRQFALRLKVQPLTISRILRKLQDPTLEMAVRIENETYGKVTCRELLGDKSKKIGKKKQRSNSKDSNDKLKLRVGDKTRP